MNAFLALAMAVAGIAGGLHGVVHVGPIRPVCTANEPCDRPAQVTIVFTRRGVGKRVRSDGDGRYRIALAPGIYAVSTVERIGIRPNITPRLVKVRPGHVDRLDFSIDTGIR